MKKKVIIMLIIIFFTAGCVKINNLNYDEIINNIISSKYNLNNQYRTGYKYYLPNGVIATNSKDYNEALADEFNNYYLYVDVVSYYNRVISEYTIDPTAFYSTKINYEDKYGYLEINKQQNNKYLIEIMYNYAKIEMIVDYNNIKESITNAIIILSSIQYNNDILANLVGDNVLQFNEEEFNIFQVKKDASNFLDVESNNIYEDTPDAETEDPDLVN
jgi:hypothetical protein